MLCMYQMYYLVVKSGKFWRNSGPEPFIPGFENRNHDFAGMSSFFCSAGIPASLKPTC